MLYDHAHLSSLAGSSAFSLCRSSPKTPRPIPSWGSQWEVPVHLLLGKIQLLVGPAEYVGSSLRQAGISTRSGPAFDRARAMDEHVRLPSGIHPCWTIIRPRRCWAEVASSRPTRRSAATSPGTMPDDREHWPGRAEPKPGLQHRSMSIALGAGGW